MLVAPGVAIPAMSPALTYCQGLPGRDCRNLVPRGRCDDCRRAWDRDRRPPPDQRGHGPDYDRARALLLAGGPWPCELQLPGCTGTATTADYVVPWSQGGTIRDGLRRACAHCNTARGAGRTD